jgi:hypothetical protein
LWAGAGGVGGGGGEGAPASILKIRIRSMWVGSVSLLCVIFGTYNFLEGILCVTTGSTNGRKGICYPFFRYEGRRTRRLSLARRRRRGRSREIAERAKRILELNRKVMLGSAPVFSDRRKHE